jgi:uncharacterized iron-regulated membrane protein
MKRVNYLAHLWLGLILGLYFVVIGITGSLLIFGREIDVWLNPQLLTVKVEGEKAPLSVVMANFQAAYPKLKASYINYPTRPDSVYSIRIGPNQASQLYVYLNPYTGKVIGERTRAGHLYGFLCYLHFYLLYGQTGWNANGYGAILLTVLLLTGVWLWWPNARSGAAVWKSRFRIKTGMGMKKLLYDIHNVAGIYPLAFSLIFTLTTIEFIFPDATKAVVYAVTGEVGDPKITVTPKGKAKDLDELVRVADSALDGQIRRVSFPSSPTAPLTMRKEWEDWNVNRNHASLSIDPYEAKVLHIADTRNAGIGRKIIQYCIPLHYGIWGGIPVRIVYVFLGLVPLVAFVTGFWHWRLREQAAKQVAEKVAAAQAKLQDRKLDFQRAEAAGK